MRRAVLYDHRLADRGRKLVGDEARHESLGPPVYRTMMRTVLAGYGVTALSRSGCKRQQARDQRKDNCARVIVGTSAEVHRAHDARRAMPARHPPPGAIRSPAAA